ncbi:MAG TPA: protein translocase subunit SecF [Candidatus Limnocylindria bacterium]|jgi:preprotein translocase subunit SecF|nr:protein translocase subunit SecF [Candidatus Limnocylindria bacterium]
MLKFVERKWWYFGFSGLLIVPGLIFLLLGGLKPGIEFKGGTLLDVRFDTPPTVAEVTEVMAGLGRREAIVQVAEGGRIEIRTFEMTVQAQVAAETALRTKFGANVRDVKPETVSPSFSGELIDNAVRSIALASVLIVLLIAFAFRNFGWAAFRYGIAAIVSLLHDAALVLGLFAILGYFFNVEIDSLFVTAVLTIIGFSVHDTIVVFDRIRENLRLNPGEALNPIINFSIMQTLARSVITSLTVCLTLLALYLFGGFSMRNFALALLVGIVSGTYSSIFNASQIVSLWQEVEDRLRHRATPSPA